MLWNGLDVYRPGLRNWRWISRSNYRWRERRRSTGHSWSNFQEQGPSIAKKRQIRSCITWFFKNNKKWVLFCPMFKENSLFFSWNPSLSNNSDSFPNNNDIFVRAKRVSLFWKLSIFEVSLLWGSTVLFWNFMREGQT